MIRNAGNVAFIVFAFWLVGPLGAQPDFLARFKNDPFRRVDADGCNMCHVNPKGGGTRNEFGKAFEDAGNQFTPMMRANFPDRFEVPAAHLSDGSVFYFADPKSQYVVYERNKQKFLFDLAAMTAPKQEVLPPKVNRMTFFITSTGLGNGGHLQGLGGADRQCQSLAEAVGAGDRKWRAYLSTSFEGQPTVNAGDRIGAGPWFNAKGVLVARGVADLHKIRQLPPEVVLNEKGEVVRNGHLLTGSNADGTAAIGLDCDSWTSNSDGKAMAGHIGEPGDRASSWNTGQTITGCSQKQFQTAGAEGLLYCFAVR